jgi:FKBP-type peptidyl-prolyl cis-trans isomerase 2
MRCLHVRIASCGFAAGGQAVEGNRMDEVWAHGGDLHPGKRVRHPQQPDWGEGQVQSVIGQRVTVNFEHVGKILINIAKITLDTLEE